MCACKVLYIASYQSYSKHTTSLSYLCLLQMEPSNEFSSRRSMQMVWHLRLVDFIPYPSNLHVSPTEAFVVKPNIPSQFDPDVDGLPQVSSHLYRPTNDHSDPIIFVLLEHLVYDAL